MLSESSVKMFEIRVSFQGKHWALPLADGIYGIGREPACEISVSDPNMSGEHAALHVEGEQLLLCINEGRRPVEIQGQFVSRANLTNGSTFTIGSTTFTI